MRPWAVALELEVHGAVARRALLDAGIEDGWIRGALDDERLHHVHDGVYAVGRPELTVRGLWMAAVLAGGDGAVLSHRDAAALHDLRRCSRARIDITVPNQNGRDRPGLDIHRVRRLDPRDVSKVDLIPVTTPERTLLDLCDVLPLAALERACERAYMKRVLRPVELHRQLTARGRRTRKLAVALRVPPRRGRSDAEEKFMALLAAHGVPAPIQNLWFPELQCEGDFVWWDERLVVELDVGDHHRTPHGIERDTSKDERLRTIGFRVLRVPEPNLAAVRAVKRALRAG